MVHVIKSAIQPEQAAVGYQSKAYGREEGGGIGMSWYVFVDFLVCFSGLLLDWVGLYTVFGNFIRFGR